MLHFFVLTIVCKQFVAQTEIVRHTCITIGRIFARWLSYAAAALIAFHSTAIFYEKMTTFFSYWDLSQSKNVTLREIERGKFSANFNS
jgi:hypothetical protein